MIGKTLSHFRVLSKLGEGGMGVVYRAEDIELQRPVALKVLRPEFVGREERRARFIQEARTAAQVTHPNVAHVYEIGEAEGETFIAMELVEGESLRSIVNGRPLAVEKAIDLAAQIADGVASAHKAQVIHRDLKPGNIMVDREGRAKVLDFGLAKLLEETGESESGSDDQETVSGLTREGRILGTVEYMSLEQARGLAVDSRSDVFSFGITLYEMVTGREPFHGETPTDTLTHILRDEPEPTLRLNPDVPPELARIIAKCLEKDPSDRYQDTRDLFVDLNRLRRDSGSRTGSRETVAVSAAELPAAEPASSGSGEHTPAASWSSPWPWIAIAAISIAGVFWGPQFVNRVSTGPAGSVPSSLAVMTFQNLKDTDDPERLGQILQELIITDLSGFDFLRVFSSQRLFDIQKQLSGSEDRKFDREAATRVARTAGAETMLEGSLSQLGSNWIMTAQLIDVSTGTVVDSERIDGTDLYAMVDRLTERLQGKLSSQADVELAAAAVRDKTTSSLDAYRQFLVGVDLLNAGLYRAAADTLGQAIERDPSFGKAYYKHAMALWWASLSQSRARLEAEEPLKKLLAEDLAASRQDRLMAEAALGLIREDWSQSIELYEQVTALYPDEKEGWYGLGEALFHSETVSQAESLAPFERAIGLDPSFSLAYKHVFDIYGRQGRFADARRRVDAYIDADPEDPVGYRWRVVVAAKHGQAAEFATALEEARPRMESPKALQNMLIDAARELRERGDLFGARALLLEAGGVAPAELDLTWYAEMINVMLRLREFEVLDQSIEQALESFPEHEEFIQRARLEILSAKGEFETAIAFYEQARERWPDFYPGHTSLQYAYLQTGRQAEFEERLQHDLDAAGSSLERAGIYASLAFRILDHGDDPLAAKVWFEKAVAEDENGEAPWLVAGLAWCRVMEGALDEAQSLFRRALSVRAGQSPAVVGLATIPLLQNRPAEAERILRERRDTTPLSARYHRWLALALAEQERYEDAEPYARRAVQMNDSSENLTALAWVLIAGDLGVDEGIELAGRAQAREKESLWSEPTLPFLPSPEHCLGLAEIRRGRVEAGVIRLEEAARLRPDRPRIQQDIERARQSG
jgi:serine/threonine protein kinase/tetratricopeptide (TPR) repeat protein